MCVHIHTHVNTCVHANTHDHAHIHIGHMLRKHPFDLEHSAQVCLVSQLSLMAPLRIRTLGSNSPESRNIAEDLIRVCPMSGSHIVMLGFSCQFDTTWDHL